MPRKTAGETPYSLTYWLEVVIPAKIGIPIARTNNYNEGLNKDDHKAYLDHLEECREKEMIRERMI